MVLDRQKKNMSIENCLLNTSYKIDYIFIEITKFSKLNRFNVPNIFLNWIC